MMDYEENIQAFYQRKTNSDISYAQLLQSAKNSLSEEVIQQLAVRTTEDNLFFTVQFCHLLLSKKGMIKDERFFQEKAYAGGTV